MVDNAVLAAAVLFWLAAIYEACSLTMQRENRARRALLLTFVALALAATFFVPSVYVATQRLTTLNNLADLVARCAVLMASFGAQSLLLHLTQEPARTVLWRVVAEHLAGWIPEAAHVLEIGAGYKPWLVRAYLRSPVKPFAGQMLVIARKSRGA